MDAKEIKKTVRAATDLHMKLPPEIINAVMSDEQIEDLKQEALIAKLAACATYDYLCSLIG